MFKKLKGEFNRLSNIVFTLNVHILGRLTRQGGWITKGNWPSALLVCVCEGKLSVQCKGLTVH